MIRIAILSGACIALAWVAQAAPKLTVLQDLTIQTGGGPEYPPIIGQDGVLYGTTYTSNNGGGIYSIGRNGKNFAVLYQFPGGAGGSGPFGGLVQGQDGFFYGTTLYDGTSGQGTVFQFDATARTVTILHAFDVADGANPYSGLVQDAQGNLYGTTSAGGANKLGTIYRIASGTHGFTKLADVGARSGGTPYAPLLVGQDGLLYGTTTGFGTNGKGSIFRLSPQGGKLEVIHEFSGTDGANPSAGLTQGPDGILYGDAEFGGANQLGTVFAFSPASRKLTVLHDFAKLDGAAPGYGVTLDSAGRILGTTFYDGANNAGTIWRYDPGSSSFKVLRQLLDGQAGTPNAGLTYAGGRMFFGGTLIGPGGDSAAGTIFKFME